MDIESKTDQVKGKAEQAVGDATDNQDLVDKGERHETGGRVKETISKLHDKLDDTIDAVENKIDHNRDESK